MSLPDYLQVIRRRWWLVVACVVGLPAIAIVVSLGQAKSFSATAEVLLSHQDVNAALSGATQASSASVDADRDTETQAGLARVPAIISSALEEAESDISVASMLSDSSVSSSPNSDILTFEVHQGTGAEAQTLVNAYAHAFSRYRQSLDTTSLHRALDAVIGRLRSLAAIGDQSSELYKHLSNKREELRVALALQTPHAVVVRTADSATQVQPKPARNAIVAIVLAAILGIALAFVWDALDTKMRSAAAIAERLKLPLLARLPRPSRRLLREGKLLMLAEPNSPDAEPFRVLRTNLDLVNVDRNPRIVMASSALQEEGKSTTVANFAVAAALAGRGIILIDLDLRRGNLDELFGLPEGRPGVTDVALGNTSLWDALIPIDLSPHTEMMRERFKLTGPAGDGAGQLHVLPAGHFPPDPGDFVVSEKVALILAQARQSADLVLVDAPPFLQAGDATAIAARVDAVLVVTKLTVRRPVLDELAQALDRLTADKLGVVVTDDGSDRPVHDYYSHDWATEEPRQAAAAPPATSQF